MFPVKLQICPSIFTFIEAKIEGSDVPIISFLLRLAQIIIQRQSYKRSVVIVQIQTEISSA